jgi:glycine/D-amino acid oxidase-like deaminating enzyme
MARGGVNTDIVLIGVGGREYRSPGRDSGADPRRLTSMHAPTPDAGGSFWFTTADPGPLRSPAAGRTRADVAIVGGGFTGLWTAIALLDAQPSLRVVVLEAARTGDGASGRNGGFCAASLTHGLPNGLRHFPDEIDVLEAEGRRNLAELVSFVAAEGIDAELEETGAIDVATEPWQVDELQASAELAAAHGSPVELLDRAAVRAAVDSPRFLAGVRAGPEQCVLVNPAKLAWGLAAAAERRGAVIHEASRVTALRRRAGGVEVVIDDGGVVEAAQVLIGTSAYSMWLRRLAPSFVPIYDYALMTEPLSEAQLAAIGWAGREGLSDAGNEFHYFRRSRDDRILWGGHDAIYHPGNRVHAGHDRRPETFATLERTFAATFPQLDGIRFTHRWGGAIDTTTRFHVWATPGWGSGRRAGPAGSCATSCSTRRAGGCGCGSCARAPSPSRPSRSGRRPWS